jgi:hypothetical protein
MHRIIVFLVCCFSFVGVAHAGWFSEKMWGPKGAAERMNDEEANKLLHKISSDANKTFPSMIDKNTEILNTAAYVNNGERNLYYFNRLIKYKNETFTDSNEINNQKKRLISAVCSQQSMEVLRS